MGTISKVTAGGATHYIASTAYCYCSTAAGTAAKTATLIGDQADSAATAEFTLIKGTTIHVKFANANTAASATLNVAGTGAKNICAYGTTAIGTSTATSWTAGGIVSFTYDGTSWVMNDYIANTNTDTKVTQTVTTTNANYPLLLAPTGQTANTTTTSYFGTKFQANPSTGVLTATGFSGSGASLTSLNASNIGSGTLAAARLATSGATAGSYGPSADASPAHSGTFSVPYITVDTYGRVTAASTKTITLPADANTNNAVTQTISSTSNADYRVLMSSTADDTTRTEGARKDTDFKYNPSTNSLSVGNIKISEITIQTGTDKRQKISLETLFTWLMTTQKYIPSNVDCCVELGTTWSYANNDILQFTANGVNYELDLAGVIIEFKGKATAYNLGRFRFIIHSNPSPSFTVSSGYTQFPASSIAEYWCNGSSTSSLYNPVWKVFFGTAVSVGSASGWSAGTTPTLGTAIAADDITAWTTNVPTKVTSNTVVTGGTTTDVPNISKKTVVTGVTKKTVVTGGTTTNIPNIAKKTVVTGVTKKTVVTGGTTTNIPNISKKTVVTSASGATAAISDGLLTITNGSFSTGDSVTVGTAIAAYTSLTTGDSVTVTTGDSVTVGDPIAAYTSLTTGDSVTVTTGDSVTVGTAIKAYTGLTTGAACSVTAGTAASLSYTARSIPNVTNVGTTPSLTVTSTRVAGA